MSLQRPVSDTNCPVGIVVNPWAGKDVRRLHAPAGHTPDTAKVGIVRRIAIAARAAGAPKVYVARDVGRIAERAIDKLDFTELVDGPGTGSALDTRRGAAQLSELDCLPIVVLGGDGTCRDVAIGAPSSHVIAVSTGTNNVFPVVIDGSSAGTAAGLVASAAIAASAVGRYAKLLTVDIEMPDGRCERDIALVDVALIDATRTGARAVLRAGTIRAVVAAIAEPASTGMSAIAGRVRPLGRDEEGAVVVRIGEGGRRVRVPIVPGAIDVLSIASIESIGDGEEVVLDGPGVIAYDGERERVLPPGAAARVSVARSGPCVIDVDRTLRLAAERDLFDVTPDLTSDVIEEGADGGD